MLDLLLDRLETSSSTLIFTNTRNQAERWYQALFERMGPFAGQIALHHGSIDAERRREVEEGVRGGTIRWVVATSSLDLGIDFHPVETVVQIGSPKGIARLLQRAGRSGHAPGRRSRLVFVPTHALELVELEAVRRALAEGRVEPRHPMEAPFDVLAQHLVTLAAGPGFLPQEAFAEVRATRAYESLERRDFDRVLRFIRDGGESLSQYPDYRRVLERDGRYRIAGDTQARLHRAAIGTITSRGMVRLQFTNRKPVGAVEEAFVARLRKGEVFHFAGHALEFVMLREGTAYVRRAARAASSPTATWVGSGLPYSQTLSAYVRQTIAGTAGAGGESTHAPGTHAAAVLAEQARISALPGDDELLVEILESREAEHLFIYPFEGTALHEALGAVVSRRISRDRPMTLTVTANDYGIELRAPRGSGLTDGLSPALFTTEGLLPDLQEAVNVGELAKRRFRGIAQIAGLVFPGYPGQPRRRYELQASATLFYEVFRNHDPGHVLLEQARREVLDTELLSARLAEVTARLSAARPRQVRLERPGPLAFPLMVKELAARVSSESLAARVERMKRRWMPGAAR
jgi:ATP-dependent Lhr-like helicase